MAFQFKAITAAIAVGVGLSGCMETNSNSAVSASASANRNVMIVNKTGRTIWRFYGSNVGTNSWEEDILGSTVLVNGESAVVNFDDGTGYCNFDMKAEFKNGDSVVRNNVNVCTAASVTFQ